MTGTAKQIAYANDIITKAVARIDDVITKGKEYVENREMRIGAKVPGYVETKNREVLAAWEEIKAYLEDAGTHFETAAEIIDFEKDYGWFKWSDDCVCEKCGQSIIV